MTRLVTGLLALALFLLTITGMKNADVLARQSTSISLRWRQALDATTASAAREKQPGLTLWGQTEEPLTTGWRQVQATLITYQGDPALVWDPACLSGALPAPLDASGCAVSAALAWALFGSEDAVGLTLTWGDAVYTVRGIFDSEDCLALLPDETAAFTAAELPTGPETWQDPAAWVEAQLRTSGLPDPDWTLYPAGPALLARLLAWLPLAFAAGAVSGLAGRPLPGAGPGLQGRSSGPGRAGRATVCSLRNPALPAASAAQKARRPLTDFPFLYFRQSAQWHMHDKRLRRSSLRSLFYPFHSDWRDISPAAFPPDNIPLNSWGSDNRWPH